MRGVVLLGLVAGSVAGQFENLATVDDGSVVYFTTGLRPRNSDHPPLPKVYRLAGGEFRLVAAAEPREGAVKTEGWRAEGASVSGDGRVLAFNSLASCSFGLLCVKETQEFSSIQADGLLSRYKGRAQISRSGRHGLLFRTTGFGLDPRPDDLPLHGVSRLDLKTGAITFVGREPADTGRWIAKDGSILTGSPPSNWELVGPSGVRETLGRSPNGVTFRAVLADDASFVVYEFSPHDPSGFVSSIQELRIRDRTGADRLLVPNGKFPSISADSRQILYLAPVGGKLQAFLLGRGAALARQVSFEPEGLTEAVLSGDAGRVVAVTGLGRLVTLNLRNGARAEYIGITPKVEPFARNIFGRPEAFREPQVPGSVYSIRGEHLAPETVNLEPPLPFEIEGMRVLVSGVPAALYQITPEQITYQVAWETPVGEPREGYFPPAELVLQSGDPGWEVVLGLSNVKSFLPESFVLGHETVVSDNFTLTPAVYAIHGDWRGPVTHSDPARPGEYVHAYAKGWGAVDPPVPTGFVSPSDPPAMALKQCDWGRSEVRVALAPGLVGIYQITARIPEGYGTGYFGLTCEGYLVVLSAFVQRP